MTIQQEVRLTGEIREINYSCPIPGTVGTRLALPRIDCRLGQMFEGSNITAEDALRHCKELS